MPIERLKASLAAAEADELAHKPARLPVTVHASRFGVAAAVILFCAGIVVGRVWPTGPALLHRQPGSKAITTGLATERLQNT